MKAYNASLTKEQRKKNTSKAGKARWNKMSEIDKRLHINRMVKARTGSIKPKSSDLFD